jgi:hypothetical protein
VTGEYLVPLTVPKVTILSNGVKSAASALDSWTAGEEEMTLIAPLWVELLSQLRLLIVAALSGRQEAGPPARRSRSTFKRAVP